jgi:NodT family efflux transporter outer membrane factor (OMF) lipoprotein
MAGPMKHPRHTPDTSLVNNATMTNNATMILSKTRLIALAGFTSAGLLLSGCAVGPNYVRPNALAKGVATPPAFKEAEGWKQATPSDEVSRQDWWRVFNDPVLNDLEAQVLVSNQNLAQSEAAYRQAKALLDQQRATLFPTINLTGSATDSKSASGFTSSTGFASPASKPVQTYTTRLGLSWDLDIWGRVRRTIEAAKANAQASAGDLANATLSAQTLVAADYFQLREADEEKRLIDQTVKGYADNLRIAQNRFNVGVGARSDVLTAQTQLGSAQAQAVDLVRTRAQLEHAIALLVGKAPADLTIKIAAWNPVVPAVPVTMPSTLLERRPDIAAAERRVQAANAQIGVQTAAYFPDLAVSGQDGFTSTVLSNLFRSTSNTWSLGATATQTVLDWGATRAKVKQSRASYDSAVASYRQTVLTAFQQVEDNIAALRVLESEYELDQATSRDADEAEKIVNNQYQAGQVDYTNVVVSQNTALSARRTVLQAARSRLVAMVDLVQAMGGGWSATQLAEK